MSWAELVAAQHGESAAENAEPEGVPSQEEWKPPADERPMPSEPEPAPEASGVRSEIATEVRAAFNSFLGDLRSPTGGMPESARAEVDRVTQDLLTRLKRVEDDLDSRVRHISEQVGWIDHRVASTLESTKEDVQDLALRIERGLAEATDRISQVEQLRAKTDALETVLHNVLDNIDEMGAVSRRPVAEFSGTLPLNDATFEQLRGLGFSVTQSARIIAYRDTHGGFSDMDELREVRGLSQEDLRLLAERATL